MPFKVAWPEGMAQRLVVQIVMTDNVILIIVGVCLAVAAVTGFMRGFIAQIGQIAGLVVGIIASRVFSPQIIAHIGLGETDSASTAVEVMVYVAVFLVAFFVTVLIARLVRGVAHAVALGLLDRIAGAIFKVIKWAFFLSLFYNLLLFCGFVKHADKSHDGPWAERFELFAPTLVDFAAAEHESR